MAPPRTPKSRATTVARRLAAEYPEAICELDHTTPFELLTATILSAQCTDARVNLVTPALFARYPTPADLAAADPTELEEMIRTTGFFQSKARSLLGMARGLVDGFGGEVPTALDDLVTLPGVGRKTANLVRVVAFGQPGIVVDTHVGRAARRLGLTEAEDATVVEHDLGVLVPRAQWGPFGLRLLLHGRRVCVARAPRCGDCVLSDVCVSSSVTPPKPRRTRHAE